MWELSRPFDPSKSHEAVSKLQIFSMGEQVAETQDFIDGHITEKWVTGIRATMSLEVEPSRRWLNWLDLPGLEILPFAGLKWGRTTEWIPMGVFPVLGGSRKLPINSLTIDAEDHYQRVRDAEFLYPTMSYVNFVGNVAGRLMQEVASVDQHRIHPVTKEPVYTPRVITRNDVPCPPVLWDKDRHQAIVDLVESIGAEAFFDRYGQPTVKDRNPVFGRYLYDGPGGSLISIDTTVDWSNVVNSISVVSGQNDYTVTPPVVVTITDPAHPAHYSKIGNRFLRWSSKYIVNEQQALKAGQVKLAKMSQPSQNWSITCVPDPTREPGDFIAITAQDLGVVWGAVLEVTHPLGDGAQSIKLGATPDRTISEEDEANASP